MTDGVLAEALEHILICVNLGCCQVVLVKSRQMPVENSCNWSVDYSAGELGQGLGTISQSSCKT